MKKLIIILVLFSFRQTGLAQGVTLSGILEKTVSGNQYGTQLAFRTKSKWNIGGFYQESFQTKTDIAVSKNPFYGISLGVPLVKANQVNFYVTTRAGIVNNIFVVVVPGLETEIELSKVISLSAMMSVRMSYPSALFKVNIKI